MVMPLNCAIAPTTIDELLLKTIDILSLLDVDKCNLFYGIENEFIRCSLIFIESKDDKVLRT